MHALNYNEYGIRNSFTREIGRNENRQIKLEVQSCDLDFSFINSFTNSKKLGSSKKSMTFLGFNKETENKDVTISLSEEKIVEEINKIFSFIDSFTNSKKLGSSKKSMTFLGFNKETENKDVTISLSEEKIVEEINKIFSFIDSFTNSKKLGSSKKSMTFLGFNKETENKHVTISLSEEKIVEDGVFNMENNNIEALENYIQLLNKIFFFVNSIVFAITSLFIIIPVIFWSLDRMQPYEVVFSSIVGITGNLILFRISHETKAKVVEECRQKMNN